MAPACILLNRSVTFCDHPLEPEPVNGRGVAGLVGGTTATSSQPLSHEAIEEAVAMYQRAMIPILKVVDPPGVSRLTLMRPLSSDLISKYRPTMPPGLVAAADKNLILLYAGSQRPTSSFQGRYLLFDAVSSSLFPIPGVCRKLPYRSTGFGTIIMAREDDFVLAEMLYDAMAEIGMLCIWQGCEWVYKVGRLSDQLSYKWKVHMSFPVQSRNLFCWVDLLQGLLLCDLGRHCNVDSSDLETSFVPLPDSCFFSEERYGRLNPQEFRTMACVDGDIKFLTMHGFVEGGPISLVTYTLDLDGTSPSWKEDTVLRLDDLWADQTFISRGLPRVTPLFPSLSTHECDIVYLVIPGDADSEEGYHVSKVKLLLSVDTRKTKVISDTKKNCPRTLFASRYILAFNASPCPALPDLKFHKRAVEATEMEASGKMMKFE